MWEVHKIHNSVHVIPEDDQKSHQCSPDCECGVKYEDGVYIHNSFDERELTESLRRC